MDLNSTNNLTMAGEYVPFYMTGLMRANSCLIMFLNASVLICLAKGRHRFPSTYWYQMLCITVNDIFAGMANFVISFLDYPVFAVDIIPCSLTIWFFFATQCATLYNILTICVSRFVVLKNLGQNGNQWEVKHTIYGAGAAWTISAVLCSIPFLLWSDSKAFAEAPLCSVKTAFGRHASHAMQFLFCSFLVPLLLTNIVYTIIFACLRRSVEPIQSAYRFDTAGLTVVRHDGANYNDKSRRHHRIDVAEIKDKEEQLRLGQQTDLTIVLSNNDIGINMKKQFADPNEGQESSSVTDLVDLADFSTQDIQCKDTSANASVQTVQNSHKHEKITVLSLNGRQDSVLRVQKAFTLLGFILIALNVFTWPGMSALVLGSMLQTMYFSRALILPLFATISLNSIVNPILYTARVPEFREVFVELFLSCCKT